MTWTDRGWPGLADPQVAFPILLAVIFVAAIAIGAVIGVTLG